MMPEAERSRPARLPNLDVLRGLAILGILLLNLPGFGTYYVAFFDHPPSAGWSPADQFAWQALELLVEGSQRGLLQLLFGAVMVILAARAERVGDAAATGHFYRRNAWLLVFGLAHVYLLLFPGDILFIYALAAMLAWPLRKLPPAVLLALSLAWVGWYAGEGLVETRERAALQQAVTAGEPEATAQWNELAAELQPDPDFMAQDRALRLGPFVDYARYGQGIWWQERLLSGEILFFSVPEALAAMLLGAALFKWRVLQGGRSRRFYLWLALLMYAIALPPRWIDAQQWLAFTPAPRLGWITNEAARLALTLGHVALVNLLLGFRAGAWLLAPFQAAGRTALSLYLMQSVICGWLLFPGIGLGWFGRFGWAGLTVIGLVIILAQLLLANLWLRWFRMGPVEWLWRRLAGAKESR